MKDFLLIFFTYVSFVGLAQSEFGPSKYFYFNSYGFGVVDSLFENDEEIVSVHLPNYPGRYKSNFKSRQRKLHLISGNHVHIDEIGDSLIIYQEGLNFSSSSWERNVTYHGELKRSNKFIMNLGRYQSDVPLHDEFGEPLTRIDSNGVEQYIYDTAFGLVPDGLWYCKIDSLSYEMGEYDMGERIGQWKVFSSKNNTFRQHPILRVKSYEDGMLLETQNFNTLEELFHPAQIRLAIEGKWHNTGLTFSEVSWRIQGAPFTYVFSRDSNEYIRSGRGVLDFLNLKSDGTFDKIVGRSCGTGRNYNESNRRKEWLINKERQLVLDNCIYSLVFLSEDKMVILRE